MKRVVVMADTITQMPQEIADRYDITIVPMGIVIDGKLYRENEVNLPEFYQKLLQIKETEKLPTSSSISAGEFLEACRELSQKAGGHCIHKSQRKAWRVIKGSVASQTEASGRATQCPD